MCVGALLAHAVQGTVDSLALQPSPGPLAHGPRQSPDSAKRPHADIKEPRVKPPHVDNIDDQRWTLLSDRRTDGCPYGRRNADAHECLHAIEEAVVGIYVVAGFKVLTNFDHAKEDGWSASIPPGCSYSNVTQRAIFNHNQTGGSFRSVNNANKDNYRHVCTNDKSANGGMSGTGGTDGNVRLGMGMPKVKTEPKAEYKAEYKAEPKNKDAAAHAGTKAAAEIGNFISGSPQSHSGPHRVDSFKSEGGPFAQFVCDTDTSVLETCPNIMTRLSGPAPNLIVPAGSRLLFAGPDHLMEVYAAVLAANGGCASRVNGTVCVLSNGAKLAFLRSLGQEETDELADSFALTHWTHGFFMEPHGPPYKGEHVGERYWELRESLGKRRKDPTGPDMCLPIQVKDGKPIGSKTGFADYRKCMNAKPHLLRFRRLLRGAGRTLAVPWHVAPPPDHESLQNTYFTRPWAVMMDCRPNLRPRHEASSPTDLASASFLSASPTPTRASPAPLARGKGAMAARVHASPAPSPSAGGKFLTDSKAKTPLSFLRSLAQGNPHGVRKVDEMFNPMESQILTDLQCVTVCEPGKGQSCYHGPVSWMAHDLLALAK